MKLNLREAIYKLKLALEIIENRLKEVDLYNEESGKLVKIQEDLETVGIFLNRIKAREKLKFNMKNNDCEVLVESVLDRIDQMDSSGEEITYLKDIKANLERVKSFLHDYWRFQN